MKYVAEDGTVFDTEEGCVAYEAELKKLSDEKEKARAEVDLLYKEFLRAGEKYADALTAYNDKYVHDDKMDEVISFGDFLAWLLS